MTRRNTKRDRVITAAVRLWRGTHNVDKVSLEDAEFRHVAEDSRLMTALIRVFYYGLFQKEFDFATDLDANKEAK